MSSHKIQNMKLEHLKVHDSLNKHPEKVSAEIFNEGEFFDPHDAVQVKYEMLRAVQKEGKNVTEVSKSFGFARRTFYETRSAFQEAGVLGLALKKRGPKMAHKLSATIVDYMATQIEGTAMLTPAQLATLVRRKFSVSVHPRSIERALARRKKK